MTSWSFVELHHLAGLAAAEGEIEAGQLYLLAGD